MVTPAARLPLPAVTPTVFTTQPAPTDYRLGETARSDILTPTALIVVDAAATETLRQQEAERIPVIFRFNPQAADEVENAFRAACAGARERFHAVVEANLHALQRDEFTVTWEKFQEIAAKFQAENSDFPAPTDLLAAWAEGDPGDDILSSLVATLRGAMGRYILPAHLPADIKPSHRVRVVRASPDDDLTLEAAGRQTDEMEPAQLVPLAEARTELLAAFPPEDQAIANLLAGFLKENCVLDAELTRQSRDKHTQSLFSADRYEPGQVIVRRGQTIDNKTKAALDQLNDHEHWKQRALLAEQRAEQATAMVRTGLLSQIAHYLTNDLVKRLIGQRDHLRDTENQAAHAMTALDSRLERTGEVWKNLQTAYEKRIAELEKELAERNETNHTLIKAKIAIARKQMSEAAAHGQPKWN